MTADPLRKFLAVYGLSNTSGERHKARRALLEDVRRQLEAEASACMDTEASYAMEQAYRTTLEGHLRVHGCACDFADVADDPASIRPVA